MIKKVLISLIVGLLSSALLFVHDYLFDNSEGKNADSIGVILFVGTIYTTLFFGISFALLMVVEWVRSVIGRAA